jgi:phosphohistidine phosphatase SixA
MKLYLVRHGHAAQTMIDPGLSEEGADAVRRMAEHLSRVVAPVEIRHSVKRRARETAEIFGPLIGVPTEETVGLLPHDPVEALAEEVAFTPDDLMIVSHLPWLDRMMTALAFPNGGGDRIVMTPGSAVMLERADVRPGEALWWIRWFVTPEVMP